MVSSQDNAALAEGEFRVFQNCRVRAGCIRVRGGVVDKGATGLAAGTVVGAEKVVLSGTTYQLVAIDTGSAVRCYYSPDTAFTEFTSATGKYGNTRFATGSTVVFAGVRDTTYSAIAPFTAAKSGRDLVYASDGTTSIVWDPSETTTDNAWCAPHTTVWHPGEGKVRQEATYPYFISLAASNLAAGATTGTGAIADNTAHAVTGGTCPTWQFTAVNDAAVLTVTTGTNLCKNKQVWMVFDCPDDPLILEHLKVEIYDSVGAAFKTLWDPSSASSERPTVIPIDYFKQDAGGPGGRGFKMAYFPVNRTAHPDQVYTDIRLTYVGTVAYGAATAFNLIAIGGSGSTPGGSLHCVGYTNSGARAESVGIVCDNKYGVSLKNLGCQDSKNYIRIPDWAGSYYQYNIYGQQPSDANKNLGVDYLLIYRRSARGKFFYHVKSDNLATYDAGTDTWSHAGGRSALQDIVVSVDTEDFALRSAPDAYNTVAPPCSALGVAGGRLFCGSVRPNSVGSTASPSDVFVSEQDMPFRHREILKVEDGEADDFMGTSAKFPGEKVQRIVPMVGSLQGNETAVVLTDQNVWALPGPGALELSRPRRLSTKGTLSPGSVFVHGNRIIYLDEDRRLVTLIPGQEPVDLSTGRMDNILEAIPTSRLDNVYGWVFRGRYYMGYTLGGGSSNKAVLVYDFRFDAFSRDVSTDTLSWGPFFSLDIGVSGQLRFWGESGNLYEHDSSSTLLDPGSQAIVPYIEGRMVGDLWDDWEFERLGIHCQSDLGKELYAYWTGRPSGFGKTHNDATIGLTPEVIGTMTPASTQDAGNTVTFSETPKVKNGTTVTPRTSINTLVAGTVYYVYFATPTLGSFHSSYSDSLTGASPVNLNATPVTQLDIIATHVRRYSGDQSTKNPMAIVDGGAYPTWTGAMSGNKEIYALVAEYKHSGSGPDV